MAGRSSQTLRDRGVVKGDGAWRSFMAVNTDQHVHPENEEAYHETVHHEDITTLNPTTVLAAVRFIRLRKKAHAKINIIETPPIKTEDTDNNKVKETVITKQPGRGSIRGSVVSGDQTVRSHVSAASTQHEEEEEDHEIFDINLEGDDESKPLIRTRFGHTKEEMDILYLNYRKIRRKEKKFPGYCKKAWLCQSRSPKVKFCICCSSLFPRYCRCCFFMALQRHHQLVLSGSLPVRNNRDVCLDTLKHCCISYFCKKEEVEEDDDEEDQGGDENQIIQGNMPTSEVIKELTEVTEETPTSKDAVLKDDTENKEDKTEEVEKENDDPKVEDKVEDEKKENKNEENVEKEKSAEMKPIEQSVQEKVAASSVDGASVGDGGVGSVHSKGDKGRDPVFGVLDEVEDFDAMVLRKGVVKQSAIASLVEFLLGDHQDIQEDEEGEGGDGVSMHNDGDPADGLAMSEDDKGNEGVVKVDNEVNEEVKDKTAEEKDKEVKEKGVDGSKEIGSDEIVVKNEGVEEKEAEVATMKDYDDMKNINEDNALMVVKIDEESLDKGRPRQLTGEETLEDNEDLFKELATKALNGEELSLAEMLLQEKVVQEEKDKQFLQKMEHKGRKVRGLTLDDNDISFQSLRYLSNRWLNTPLSSTLERLSLAHCDLGALSTLLIVKALPSLVSLHHLSLACNPRLSIKAIAACLSEASRCPPGLRSINVSYCEAKEADLVTLVAAATRMEVHPQMRELEICQALLPQLWNSVLLAALSEALATWGWPRKVNPEGFNDSNESVEQGQDDEEEEDSLGDSESDDDNSTFQQKNKRNNKFEAMGRRIRLTSLRWLNIDDLRGAKLVSLGGHQLTDNEAFAISRSLGRNRRLHMLDMSDNRFGTLGGKAILKEVMTRKNLTVNLTGNSMHKDVVGPWLWNACNFKRLMLSTGMKLEVQQLKGEALIGQWGDVLAEPVEAMNIQEEDIGPLEQEALCNVLYYNTALTELNGIVIDEDTDSVDLSLTPLERYEVVFVSKRLSLGHSITSLNLSGCAINARSVLYLAKAIKTHRIIKKLWLDNNLLGDDGAKSLGTFFGKNCSLQNLMIGFNAMGDIGLATLLAGLLLEQKEEHKVIPKVVLAPQVLPVKESEMKLEDQRSPSIHEMEATDEVSKKDDESQAGSKEGGDDEEDDEDDDDEEEGEENEDEEEEDEEEDDVDNDSKENVLETVKEENQIVVANQSEEKEVEDGEHKEEEEKDEKEEEEEEEDNDGMEVAVLEEDKDAEKRVVPKDEQEERLLKLKGPPPLLELDISGNYLGQSSIRVLGRAPMGFTSLGTSRFCVLTTLCLRKTSIDDVAMASLASALYHDRLVKKANEGRRSYLTGDDDSKANDEPEGPRFPSLRHLDISDHFAYSHGLEKMCSTLLLLMDMKTLKLGKAKYRHPDSNGGSDIVPECTHAAVDAIVHMLGKHQSFTNVDLYNLNIGDRGAEELSKVVEFNATITTLNLEANNITGYGGEYLVRALSANIGIATISFAHNPIGRGKGVGYGVLSEIIGLLQLNNSLESLDVCNCEINGFNKAGKKGYDKYLEELIQLIRKKSYSKSFKNFRIYDNIHIPKVMLRALKDAAEPPLVIDFFAPNKQANL